MSVGGYIPTVVAIAILLSVIVRWIRSGASWAAVEEGVATAEHLRDITGIVSREALQEVFGAPRLEDGVYPVSPADVRRRRSGLGYLMGDRWFDGASALVAIAALMPIWPIWGTRVWMEMFLWFAGLYQLAGWIVSLRLLGRR